ncbi:hypothetical protein N7471_011892 [Penicillium samsonianum]|uniref:uncharacterized protein n=1 Tax=Penicillium samsonianum TaxID=1882272 RepID=UPI002549392E|nr:uncharacterized protein N7471_011892 [Penicillium samsonianum]KAJ6124575.1 hypothetical protein N7471_011892 [Penicillium samsonianum]
MLFEVCEMNHVVGVAEKPESSITDFHHQPQAAMTNEQGTPVLVASTKSSTLWRATFGFQSSTPRSSSKGCNG